MGAIARFLGLEQNTPVIINSADLLRSLGDIDIAGESVNVRTALQTSAVLCCARVIAEGLAQVPCRVYREDALGSPVEDRAHPLSLVLGRRPNDWQTGFEFREQIGFHLVLTNNAYVYKNVVGDQVMELYALDPSSVEVKQDNDRELTYTVSISNGRRLEVPASSIWHLRGPSWDGVMGLDAIRLARKTIGLAQATETFGTKLFENGARPGGILTTRNTPGMPAMTQAQRDDIKTTWMTQYQGNGNAHKTVMLPYDLDFTPISGTANEAQWIENRQFLIEEVCRFFRVLPIMVMRQGSTSYNSVEQQFLAHLNHTLMPWYRRFEQSAENNLLTSDELKAGYTVKLNHNALLRGSHTERATYYQTMRSIGVMTANEVRGLEDLPRSDDPKADELAPAANIFGGANKTPALPASGTSDNQNNDEVVK